MSAEANTSKRHTDHQRERDKAKAEGERREAEEGSTNAQHSDSDSDSDSSFTKFYNKGKCLESGKHTNISKQQH